MSRHSWLSICVGATAAITALAGAAAAKDMAGCKDPTGLKRFEGSHLVMCDYRKFDDYVVPTGKLVDTPDYTRKVFETKIDVSGRVDKNVYVVPPGSSATEVYQNYAQMLKEQGFQQLYKGKGQDELGGAFESTFSQSFKDLNALQGFDLDGYRFGAFVEDQGTFQTYVMVFASMGEPGSHHKIDIAKGDVVLRVDMVSVGKLQDQMIRVKASDMQKVIEAKGHIDLYGINFDFNKAAIKPESRPVLDEIASYLRNNPDLKLRIVGHTDGVGGPDFNQQLSQERATAVVEELIRGYAIEAERLVGEGAGMMSPVAPNDTDEGRARNRRVELVALK